MKKCTARAGTWTLDPQIKCDVLPTVSYPGFLNAQGVPRLHLRQWQQRIFYNVMIEIIYT